MLFTLIAGTRCVSAECILFFSTPVVPRLQPQLPPGFRGATYERSGWCFVEACATTSSKITHVKHGCALLERLVSSGGPGRRCVSCAVSDVEACISSAIKPSSHRFDLGLLDSDDSFFTCSSGRLPPMTPDRVKFELVNNKEFTNKSDVDKVAKLYKNFFDIVSSSVTELT